MVAEFVGMAQVVASEFAADAIEISPLAAA